MTVNADKSKHKTESSKWSYLVPVLLVSLVIPITLLLWFGNIVLLNLRYRKGDEVEEIPPTRWLTSVIVPILIAGVGYHKKSISKSGAVSGLVVGFVLTLSSYCFLACLMMFFVSSSKATKYRSDKKKKFEEEFKEGKVIIF